MCVFCRLFKKKHLVCLLPCCGQEFLLFLQGPRSFLEKCCVHCCTQALECCPALLLFVISNIFPRCLFICSLSWSLDLSCQMIGIFEALSLCWCSIQLSLFGMLAKRVLPSICAEICPLFSILASQVKPG